MRYVHMVLSARSLSYARHCLDSLLHQADEPLRLHVITDTAQDAETLRVEIAQLAAPEQHVVSVHDQRELDEIAESKLRDFPQVKQFRLGHPCWRKITDPALLAADGQEMVILDPDLFFPNRFRFEPTPPSGILLMWQRPSCLLPPETVRAAIAASYRLAHHVDIGVAHARAPFDWAWLEGFLMALGGAASLPRFMHIEAIVWAALAMHAGGGHLDPDAWRCWHRTQLKRVLLKLRAPGPTLLKLEPFQSLKCFHAGGAAKNWIAAARATGQLDPGPAPLLTATRVLPFVELLPQRYEAEQSTKSMLRRLGYYHLFGSS